MNSFDFYQTASHVFLMESVFQPIITPDLKHFS